MPVNRDQLDADIAANAAAQQATGTLTTTYIADVTAFLQTVQEPDFSAEDASVQAQIAALTASGQAVQDAINALPPPPGPKAA
jgi:hypothetical protein